ncbi:AAA family ATPase, partial [Brucella abortus]
RLIHASDGEFGLLIEIVISAAEEALLARKDHLDHLHFSWHFVVVRGVSTL